MHVDEVNGASSLLGPEALSSFGLSSRQRERVEAHVLVLHPRGPTEAEHEEPVDLENKYLFRLLGTGK